MPHDRIHFARVRAAGPALAIAVAAALAGCAEPKAVSDEGPAEYTFWPPSPDEPRIQFLVAYQYSEDIAPATSQLEDMIYGQQASRVLPIKKPYGVEMWDGKIYICDLENSGVVVLDLKQQQTRVMGVTGVATLGSPSDIAIAPDGTKYVGDVLHNMVFVFDAGERYVTRFGHEDFKPVGVAVSGDELYVCDFAGQRIVIMDRHTGQTKRTFGQGGMEDGQFIGPLGIATDSKGNIVVSDVYKGRVQKFDRQGNVVMAFGELSRAFGGFVRAKHLAVDHDDNIHVVDAAFQNVQVFNEEGRLLTYFGSAGRHPGSMYLPAGICVHEGDLELFDRYIHPAFEARRLLIVTNQFGPHKVAVYALGQLRPGKTVQDVAGQRVQPATGLIDAEDQSSSPPDGQAPPANPPEKPK